MKLFIITFGLLLCTVGNTQYFSDTLYYDSENQQVQKEQATINRVVTNDTSGIIRFFVCDYTSQWQLLKSGYYKSLGNDTKTGEHINYYANGNIKSVKNYNDNQLHGIYKNYSTDGYLYKEVMYKNGKVHGSFTTYYPNGIIKRTEKYNSNNFIEGYCYTAFGKDTTYYPYLVAPEYRGGWERLNRWIMEELEKTELVNAMGSHDDVILNVTVNKKGIVENIRLITGEKDSLIQEAIKILKHTTEWIPGLIDGNPGSVSIKIPLEFKDE